MGRGYCGSSDLITDLEGTIKVILAFLPQVGVVEVAANYAVATGGGEVVGEGAGKGGIVGVSGAMLDIHRGHKEVTNLGSKVLKGGSGDMIDEGELGGVVARWS